jgi:hypothetical protein
VFAKSVPICAAFAMKSSNTSSSFLSLESMDMIMLEKRIKVPLYTPTRQASGLPRLVAAWLNKSWENSKLQIGDESCKHASLCGRQSK